MASQITQPGIVNVVAQSDRGRDIAIRRAARRVTADLLSIKQPPSPFAEAPSVTQYLDADDPIASEWIAHADRCAYAGAITINALKRILLFRKGDPDSRLAVDLPVELPSSIGNRPEEWDRFYYSATRLLQAQFEAASRLFLAEEPELACWMRETHDALLRRDPISTAARILLDADGIQQGVEGPPETVTLLIFMARLFGAQCDDGSDSPLGETTAEMQRDVTHDVVETNGLRRLSYGLAQFLVRPKWYVTQDRSDLAVIDMKRVALRTRRTASGLRYYIDTGGQMSPLQKIDDPEPLLPRLKCPVHFASPNGSSKSWLQLYMHGVINAAYRSGAFAYADRNSP